MANHAEAQSPEQGLVVNSVADDSDLSSNGICNTGNLVDTRPECTLRSAIEEANQYLGKTTINFLIAGCPDDICVININMDVAGKLPDLKRQIVIDGSFFSCDSTENIIGGALSADGNFIGSDKSGTQVLDNTYSGISFFGGVASDNSIGVLTDGTTINDNLIVGSDSGRLAIWHASLPEACVNVRSIMKLLIRNLARATTEDEIRTMFETFGTLQSCNLVLDKKSGESKGFAFVEMPRAGEAKAAVKSLNGKQINGYTIRVKYAETPVKSEPAAE